jgi:hypothetical protein
MEKPKERRKRLIKNWDDSKIDQVEKSFKDLIDLGCEHWTQNYTLSHTDKMSQLDLMLEYFENSNIEEYEKCQYILDIKNAINTHRYML